MKSKTDRVLIPAEVEIENDSVRSPPALTTSIFQRQAVWKKRNMYFWRGNGLPKRWKHLRAGESFRIGELGFGTGLNFLVAWRRLRETATSKKSSGVLFM